MLRLLLLSVCALSLSAQSWDSVRNLQSGARVKVREVNGPEHKGNVVSVTPDAIAVSTPSGNISVDRTKVARVQLHRANRRARNIAIGAGVGFAVGLAIDQTFGAILRNEGNDSGRAITYIAPIAIFGAIGAAISPYKTVYRVP